ncbi:MAG: DUF3575 domain-containing protein [Bacteroidota bacterium]|nr:DUF3575 domain-containing protein [Bacteroidota bacterium]
MKTLAASVFVAAAVLLAARPATAQTRAFKVNLLSPFVKTGSFFYEQQLGAKSSLQLGALATYWSPDGNTTLRGFAFTPEFRRYFAGREQALNGFYVAPFLRYQKMALRMAVTDETETPYTGTVTLQTLGAGLVVGHQWRYGGRVTLDTFLGPSYSRNVAHFAIGDAPATDQADLGGFSGFGLRAGITLGVAF